MTTNKTLLGLPLMVMFGLDNTLWPFEAHHLVPPITKNRTGYFDSEGNNVTCYPEVPEVFEQLYNQGIKIAIGTMGLDVKTSEILLKMFGLEEYISYKEYYEIVYLKMFQNIHEKTNIPYNEMLFFDDCKHSLRAVAQLNVSTVRVKNGMTLDILGYGLKRFQEKNIN